MISLSEPGRLASHVLLDVLSVWNDDSAEEERRFRASNLALDRLSETGAIRVRRVEARRVELDASELVGGALVAMNWLIRSYCEDTATPEDRVLSELRAFLDAAAGQSHGTDHRNDL